MIPSKINNMMFKRFVFSILLGLFLVFVGIIFGVMQKNILYMSISMIGMMSLSYAYGISNTMVEFEKHD